MKRKHGEPLSEAERDREAYRLVRTHLLNSTSLGVTDTLLTHYCTPHGGGSTASMAQIFFGLLNSAQNRGMMATVIGKSLGDLRRLGPLLGDFSPHFVDSHYLSWQVLLDRIERDLKPRGRIRREQGSLWPLFARAIISGARFLAQFPDGVGFLEWVKVFDDDYRKRTALPFLLSQEIDGFGFALACDFLKELGFVNYAKPDVHVRAIVAGLGLSPAGRSDYAVYKSVVRIAAHCETTPYNVDKLFWLLGSGRFYDHPQLGTNGRIDFKRDVFIAGASKALGGTL